jgi:hypothetical protein
MKKTRRLLDGYRFPGFRPRAEIKGIFGDPGARIIQLQRNQKKLSVVGVGAHSVGTMTRSYGGCGIYRAAIGGSIWKWKFVEYDVGSAGK